MGAFGAAKGGGTYRNMTMLDKVLVGAAVLYGAAVIGSRLTAVAAIGTHEAMHDYLEGTTDGTVRFDGDPYTGFRLTGETAVRADTQVPHIIPKAAGWLVAVALLLPWLWGVVKVAKSGKTPPP